MGHHAFLGIPMTRTGGFGWAAIGDGRGSTSIKREVAQSITHDPRLELPDTQLTGSNRGRGDGRRILCPLYGYEN